MPPIRIFNFLTRKKEVFRPLRKGRVGLYTCGPTVYNYAHIGNLRTYIFEDVLRRTLEYAGYKVKHVMNITDVDDKTVRDSKAAGKSLKEFTRFYEKAFFEDIKKLNIRSAWKYPRATEHVKETISLIDMLLQNGLAYVAEDGVYFKVAKFKNYGKLSGLKKREIKPGARVSVDEYSKESAQDFALWKFKKRGEPAWPAFFGAGRPGWHIECSAMSTKYLGKTFDIHSAGIDLLFPHHENEIAQSEGATGKRFVKYFVEGEHLLVDGKKMSKSLGNIFTSRDLEKMGFNPLAFRYLMLSAHYRSQLNFTKKSLLSAQNSLERLYDFVKALKMSETKFRTSTVRNLVSDKMLFQKAIFDDLNTPQALAVAWDLVLEHNKNPQGFNSKAVLELLYDFDKVLGLGLASIEPAAPSLEVRRLLKKREKARDAGDFKKADELREQIMKLGWRINDTPGGSQFFHL